MKKKKCPFCNNKKIVQDLVNEQWSCIKCNETWWEWDIHA